MTSVDREGDEHGPAGRGRDRASRPFGPDLVSALLERAFVATILVLAAPIMLVAMVLVRLGSRGPVIYTQRRMGKGGRPFTIYKIRSMYVDSELGGVQWSRPGDRRVTPVGRILRATHIDELPQLFNILRGEMSLIGPRPERPEIVAQLEKVLPDYRRRLAVLPGLTGLAQVLQPPDTDVSQVRTKLFFDQYYIENRSPSLDLRILAATALHVAGVEGQVIGLLFGFPASPAPHGVAMPRGDVVTLNT
jgi:lipopolysaccharide/colanic/teichoic acid biosynthesis glycosyltransferase